MDEPADSLIRLLTSTDPAHRAQGLELGLLLDDPAITEAVFADRALLEPRAGLRALPGAEGLGLPRWLPRPLPSEPLRLLAAAPEGPVVWRCRQSLTAVRLDGDAGDLSFLAAFPRLAAVGLKAGRIPDGALAALSALPGLRMIALTGARDADLSPLAGRALDALALEDFRGGRAIDLPRLGGLWVFDSDLQAAALPRTARVTLSQCQGKPGDLGRLVADLGVRDLHAHDHRAKISGDEIARLAPLTRLVLDGCPMPGDLSALAGLRGLERLRFRVSPNVSRIDALPPAVWEGGRVEFPRSHLASVRGLADVRGVDSIILRDSARLADASGLRDAREVDVTGCKALASLAGMSDPPRLEILRAGGTGIADLSALGSAPLLRALDAQKAPIATLAGVERFPSLEVLDLRGCADLRDVGALAGLTGGPLRLILAAGVPVPRSGFPEGLRRAVCYDARRSPEDPPGPSDGTALQDVPKKRRPRGPIPPGLAGIWEEVCALLMTGHADLVGAALDRLRDAGEVALYDALLEPASVQERRLQLDPGPLWIAIPEEARGLVVGRLMADAPAGSKADAMRPRLRRLNVPAGSRFQGRVDLSWVARFDRIETARIEPVTVPLVGLEALARLPHLRHLECYAKIPDLRAFTGSPLCELDLGRGVGSLVGAADLPALRRLSLPGMSKSDGGRLDPLRGHPTLREIYIGDISVPLS